MNNTSNRRGIGMMMVVAVGILVVLTIFAAMRYLREKEVTRDISMLDMAKRAGIAADSAAQECLYFALKYGNLPPGAEGSTEQSVRLFEGLRKYTPSSPGEATEESPIEGNGQYIERYPYDVPITAGYYAQDEATETSFEDTALCETARYAWPDGAKETNEHYGVMTAEGRVRLRLKSSRKAVEISYRYAREYKVLLVHPPYPFNLYTLILRPRQDPPSGRMYDYFSRYEAAADSLPDFPVADMVSDTRPIVTTAAVIPENTLVLDALRRSPPRIPPTASDLQQFSRMRALGLHKLDAAAAAEWKEKRFYEQLTWQALAGKATHHYAGFALFAAERLKDGVLQLDGIYYVEGPVTLDCAYSGRGMIVTSSPDGVMIRRLERRGNALANRLVVVSCGGDITFPYDGSISTTVCQADLFVPNGRLRAGSGGRIEGIVYAAALEPDGASSPRIVRPNDTVAVPWKEGEPLDPEYGQKLRFFVSPYWLWKRQRMSR